MDGNAYTRFRNTDAFETATDFVDGLAEYLMAEHRAALQAEANNHVDGILSDVTWDDMERVGPRTIHSVTLVQYEYERPHFTVDVCARLDSNTYEFQECKCTVSFGDERASFHIDGNGVIRPE